MDQDTVAAAVRAEHEGKFTDAVALLAAAPGAPDLDPSAALLLARLFSTMDRLSEAEKVLQTALATAPPATAADLHLLLSQCYDARGHTRKAAAEREKAAALESQLDDATAAYLRALRLQQEPDPDATYRAAIEAIALVLKEDSARYPTLCHVAATAAYDSGRNADALLWATKGFNHTRSTPDLRVHCLCVKARVARDDGLTGAVWDRLEEATFLARAGASASTAVLLTLRIAHLLLSQGHTSAALGLLDETETRFPWARQSLLPVRVNAEIARGQVDTARQILTEAEASTRAKSRLTLVRVLVAREDEDWDTAAAHLSALLRRIGTGKAAFALRCQRAAVAARQGRTDTAEKERAALGALLPDQRGREAQSAFARLEAELAYLQEDWNAGILAWKRCLRQEPSSLPLPEIWTHIGDGYGKLGEREAARFAWDKSARSAVESIWVTRAKDRLELS